MPFDAEHASHLTRDPLTITEPRERLEYLRDFLRALPVERFYIGNYVSIGVPGSFRGTRSTADLNECGTAACIAGWTAYLFSGAPVSAEYDATTGDNPPAHDLAAGLLGLNDDEAFSLFVPLGISLSWSEITNVQAAQVIDEYLTDGVVDWSIAVAAP